jgi:hypothetical protein
VLRAFREGLRITQSFECFKRRLTEDATAFALAVLAVVGEIEQADAIRTACIREMRGGMQVLASGTAEGKHVVTVPALCRLSRSCGTARSRAPAPRFFADDGQIVLLRGEVVRGGVHHVETGGDECFQIEAEHIESCQIARHTGAEPLFRSEQLPHF